MKDNQERNLLMPYIQLELLQTDGHICENTLDNSPQQYFLTAQEKLYRNKLASLEATLVRNSAH